MVEEIDRLLFLSLAVTIAHVSVDISLELEKLLVQLPQSQVCLCPTSLASVDTLPKLPHLLQSACSKGDDPQVDFGILLNTSCSGHNEDFCGQLAYEGCGIIKMANGVAETKCFGMVHWESMDTNGNIVLIKVPTYYVPTVKMQLLSPQENMKCHEIEIEHACSGNVNFMQLQIRTSEHLPGRAQTQ